MPTRWETFSIPVAGGLLTDTPPIQTGLDAPGSAIRLVNFEPSVRGGYRRINGYEKFSDTQVTGATEDILGVAYFYGTVLAVAGDGSIRTSTGTTWTTQATGRTHSNKYRFAKYNLNGTQKLIGVDGSNNPFIWDGTSITNVTGSSDVTGSSHAVEFKDHLFYAKGGLITFSVPFDETDFGAVDGAGSFRVQEDVTGMYVFRERLFIFTRNSIRVLDGSSEADFALTSVSETVGCVEPDTIVEVAGDVAFLAADGVRLLGATERIGDFANQVASFNIESSINTFEGKYSHFHAVPIRGKRQYRIFGYNSSTSSSLSEGFVGAQYEAQNPQSFQWAELKGFKVYTADSQYHNGVENTIFANEDGYVYSMESGSTFDGVDIKSQYWTPYISFSDPTYRKTLFKLNTYFNTSGEVNGTVSVVYDLNSNSVIQPPAISLAASGAGISYGSATYGTSTYAASQVNLTEKQLVGSCFNASFQFSFDGGEPFVLDIILIEFKNQDRQ